MTMSRFESRIRSLMGKGAMVCALALASTNIAQARDASTPHNFVGWVWGNEPTATSCYTPSTSYSYNSQNGSIQICPLGTGDYEVEFGSLYHAQPDDIQITAYDTSGYCVSNGWGPSGSTLIAYVGCYDANGNPQNDYFTLLYQARTKDFGKSKKGIAFLWADEPTSSSYTPSSSYQFNSTGGTNTIVRESAGSYIATIPGLYYEHSDVQVTTYDGAARCKVNSWGPGSGGGTDIYIQCYNSAGSPADEYYDLAYAVKEPFGLTTAAHSTGAWAWADDDTSTSVYTPSTYYQYNGFRTGKLTAQKLGTGTYAVYIPGTLAYNTSHVLVTAYGSDNSNYCNTYFWGSSEAEVLCYAQGGVPADTQFDLTFQTAE
ncbi:MAG TPA: hypothetical protein VKR31_08705 [Rhizomicrobium sp.]|nr:hypothetical protein [Rhizomicrobium sp.]